MEGTWYSRTVFGMYLYAGVRKGLNKINGHSWDIYELGGWVKNRSPTYFVVLVYVAKNIPSTTHGDTA